MNNYKKQYLLGGAITTSLMPVLGFIPELGWLLISIYSLPAYLLEGMLKMEGVLVVDQEIIIYPHLLGLLITIPFWIIFGALIGWLVFYNASLRAKKKNVNILPYRWREVGETIGWVIFIYMLLVWAFRVLSGFR